MDERRELWITLAWRAILACPFAVGAGVLFATSAGCPDVAERRVLGIACVVVASIILGPGFAGLIAEPAGSLFHPRRVALPQPCRSIAEAKRAHGRYAEAISAYEAVIAEFPTDLAAWTAMIEIAFVQLQDRPRGDALARRALLSLRDEPSRLEVVRVHRRGSERLRVTELQL